MTAALASQPPQGALPFAVRIGTAADHPFVMDSWLLSERDSVGHLEGRRFTAWQKRQQREILARPSTCLRVAHPEDDPETILGWLAHTSGPTPVVYYIFTRFHSRRLGIAKMLLGDLLDAPEVLYGARLPRVCKRCGRSDCRDCPDASRWIAHPLASRMPRGWKHTPRANHYEVV